MCNCFRRLKGYIGISAVRPVLYVRTVYIQTETSFVGSWKIGYVLKGVWHEIFDFRFFVNQFTGLLCNISHWGHFEFLRKFADIFESKGSSPVSATPVINEKIFYRGSFFKFCWHAVVVIGFYRRCLWIYENPEQDLIVGVNDSGNDLSPATTTPAIIYC
jgi:hypothetical protein